MVSKANCLKVPLRTKSPPQCLLQPENLSPTKSLSTPTLRLQPPDNNWEEINTPDTEQHMLEGQVEKMLIQMFNPGILSFPHTPKPRSMAKGKSHLNHSKPTQNKTCLGSRN